MLSAPSGGFDKPPDMAMIGAMKSQNFQTRPFISRLSRAG